jgi:hypothetical protein
MNSLSGNKLRTMLLLPYLKIFFAVFLVMGISWNGLGQNFYKERIPKTNIFSIGVGPSFTYADNGGQYKRLDFKKKPSISLSYTKKLNQRFAIMATGGTQWIESGGNPTLRAQQIWESFESAFTFKGQTYFIDVMPVMYLFPFRSHIERKLINLYGGIGIGIVHVDRVLTYSSDENAPETRGSISSGYVPVRAGISYTLNNVSDLALEGTIMYTFTDDIDGNQNFNRLNDNFVQAQIVYKRFLKHKFE